jgi:hypothetical protein
MIVKLTEAERESEEVEGAGGGRLVAEPRNAAQGIERYVSLAAETTG